MTPDELAIVERDAASIAERTSQFSEAFYDTLFDLAPETRSLFPHDMTPQRQKLADELLLLVDTAATWRATGGLAGFVERAQDLGRSHASYGVTNPMYDVVGVTPLAALRLCLDGFDDAHEAVWSKLYRRVADTMREGADGCAS